MDSTANENDHTIPSINSTSSITVDVTPPEEKNADKIPSLINLPSSNSQNSSAPPSVGKKSFSYSLSNQIVGNKSLNMLPPPSLSSSSSNIPATVLLSSLPPPSLVPSASPTNATKPQMSTLAAPVAAASLVYTANKPKASPGGLAPPVNNLLTTGSATGNPRNKVCLRKGRGLMDWVKLGNTSPDLAGTGGKLLKVTAKQLAKHNTRSDAWMALKGKVYNVTPYFEYHPGGEDELCRGIGKDATDLFNEVHKWVNYESMLSKCLVGYLVESTSCIPLHNGCKSKPNRVATGPAPSSPSITKLPPIAPPTNDTSDDAPSPRAAPSYDWYQSGGDVAICVYTRLPGVTHRHCSVRLVEQVLTADIIIQDQSYHLELVLFKPVQDEFKVSVQGNGKVSLELSKRDESVRWPKIGKILPTNNKCSPLADRPREYHLCQLESKERLTHDTVLLSLRCPPCLYLPVPAGYHTYLRMPADHGLCKPYTPVPASLEMSAWTYSTEGRPGNTLYYLVKVYSDGPMSTALDSVPVGGDPPGGVEVTLAEGDYCVSVAQGRQRGGDPVTDVALLAAGTGITPMVAVMMEALTADRRVRLVLFNKTEEDIPWREQLQQLVSTRAPLLQVHHVLSRAPSSWKGLQGHVNRELLDKMLPVGDGSRAVLITTCGPRPFVASVIGLFGELGYMKEEFHVFEG